MQYSTNEPDEVVSCIDTSSTGIVAVGTFRPYSTCSVYIYTSTGSLIHRLQHNFPIAGLKISPTDPNILVTVSDHIRVWNISSGQLMSVQTHHETDAPELCPFTAISFSPEGHVFSVTDVGGYCSVWEINKRDPIEVFSLGNEKLYDCTFVTESVIACVGETGAVFVIDRDSHQVICSKGEEAHPRCQPTKLAWIPGLSLVAVAYQTTGMVVVYELKSSGESPRFLGSTKSNNQESISDICWIKSNPQYLLVARDSGAMEVWNKSNLVSPHFDYKANSLISAVCFNFGSVLIGDVNGQVVTSQLPSRMEEGGVEVFKTNERWGNKEQSYPALA